MSAYNLLLDAERPAGVVQVGEVVARLRKVVGWLLRCPVCRSEWRASAASRAKRIALPCTCKRPPVILGEIALRRVVVAP